MLHEKKEEEDETDIVDTSFAATDDSTSSQLNDEIPVSPNSSIEDLSQKSDEQRTEGTSPEMSSPNIERKKYLRALDYSSITSSYSL